ncbi:MAG: WYL domain-containing protein [Azonexus sp.]|nr:WYL domain-containing protein [Azonexus sp.]
MNTGSNDTLLRQWTMLKRIPRFPAKITSRTLTDSLQREGFAVGKRTVERDLLMLSMHFPLIADERSKPFGWSWDRDAASFDLPGMTPTQALTLVMAEEHLATVLPASIFSGLSPYIKAARNTLDSVATAQTLRDWQHKIALIHPTQPMLPPPVNDDVIEAVHQALLTNHQLKIRYRVVNSEEIKEYVVHPLGLVHRGAISYLCATIFSYEDVRILALHRIEAASVSDELARTLPGFNLDAYVKSEAFGFHNLGAIKLHIRIHRDLAAYLRETPLAEDQRIEMEASGSDDTELLTASVQDTDQLRWWILGQREQIEVLSPLSLRNELKAVLHRALVHYL